MNALPAISEYIWNLKYRLKNLDGTPIDETINDTWQRVADALAQAEASAELQQSWAEKFYTIMASGQFSPAGRIIAGAGSDRNVTLSNCYTMGTIPDSMDGIFTMLKEAALTMQAGGGIGYDFSTIRPKGSPVVGVGADASGPLSFMDVWDAMCRTVMSAGSRRGAMMATMRCDHPDIEAFIEAKADSSRLRMFNVSVLVTDGFMKAVKDNLPWRLHFENRRGETLMEKTVDARALWDKIMQATYAYAEPGVIFIDRVNRDHNLGYLETIATTNPCGEKPMGPYASCLLGSINLVKFVLRAFTIQRGFDWDQLRRVVRVAIRMMDNVIEVSRFPLEAQRKKAMDDRQLGLGVTGLADALIMMGLTYGSKEAAAFTERVMAEITLTAYDESVELAKEKGAFPTFNAEEFLFAGRFAGRQLPMDLKSKIDRYGIRNGLLVSIAPTGTISLFGGNVSSGIEPVFAFSYTRKVLQKDGSKTEERVEDYAVAAYRKKWERNNVYEKLAFDESMLPPEFVSAQTLSPEAHIVMQAAAQKWVDSSISKTVNVPEDISFEDFKAVYQLAYDMGCKGCTTYRPNEVTGSVLSVEPKAKPAEAAPVVADDMTPLPLPIPSDRKGLQDEVRAWLEQSPSNLEALRTWLNANGLKSISQVPQVAWPSIMRLIRGEPEPIPAPVEDIRDSEAAMDDDTNGVRVDYSTHIRLLSNEGNLIAECITTDVDVEFWPENDGRTITAIAPMMYKTPSAEPDNPQERPSALPGAVYKLKWPGSDHAIYVTLSDIQDPVTGQRRPFEVFINSKNMEHFAWTVALTRMISAIFRRPHDSRFVVEELKAVFDPNGGAWVDGQYVPSVLAAIGGVIEAHMRSIGYIDGKPATRAPEAVPAAVEPMPEIVPNPVFTTIRPPRACPSCGSFNTYMASGCLTCRDCGYSKCG